MGKALLIDITKCIGCYNCQLSCKDEHVANDWSPIAKPQPDGGHFWYKITETVQGTVPKVRVGYMHELCQHCDNAPCMEACNNNAIYKRDDGIVIIDPEKCRGSRICQDACPYGVIYHNSLFNISQKCTFCAHLLDDGWTEPRCVHSCPTAALKFGEESEMHDLIKDAEQLHPEFETGPRVYYINLPNKKFIAGEVYNDADDECLIGATITLYDASGKAVATQTSDEFGDFWFERQEPGQYSVKIEMSGYASKSVENIDATENINIGAIELLKA